MPSFKPVIRKGRGKKDGTTNIAIRVFHKRQIGYISTKHFIVPKEWDEERNIVIPKIQSKDDAEKINMAIAGKIGEYNTHLLKTATDIHLLTVTQLIKLLSDTRDRRDLIVLFQLMEEKKLEGTGKGDYGYAINLRATKDNLVKKLGLKTIPIDIITSDWLDSLVEKMRKTGVSDVTIHNRLRNIRMIFNKAKTGRFPFKEFKMPKVKSVEHKDLSLEQMRAIAQMEIQEPLMRYARDMFMLNFYLIGMNFRDLAYYEKPVKYATGTRINYTRIKGGKDYSIKIFPETQAIIDRYPGKTYMIDLMDRYSYYKNGTKRIGFKLKKIAELCGIDRPVSIYYARHSWASIADFLGISMDTISLCMGHTMLKPISGITEIYVNHILKSADDANEKVIRAILKNDDDDVITSLNL